MQEHTRLGIKSTGTQTPASVIKSMPRVNTENYVTVKLAVPSPFIKLMTIDTAPLIMMLIKFPSTVALFLDRNQFENWHYKRLSAQQLDVKSIRRC